MQECVDAIELDALQAADLQLSDRWDHSSSAFRIKRLTFEDQISLSINIRVTHSSAAGCAAAAANPVQHCRLPELDLNLIILISSAQQRTTLEI